MRIVRRSSFTATRWKNGGGITHEAIRVPDGADPQRWRLSVAEIAASGPFSDFTGYARRMVLLGGAGVRLRFATGGEILLKRVGDLAEFDGAVPAECDLLCGPCTDLNLMTANSITAVDAQVARLYRPLDLLRRTGETLVLFCVAGAGAVEQCTSAPANTSAPATLEQWDLAVQDGAAAACTVRSLAGGQEEAAVFIAKFKDI